MKMLHYPISVLLSLLLLGSIGLQAEVKQKQDFNLGIIIPLTGDLAEYGSSIRNGFELAKTETPSDFSRINFIYEDSKYDGRTAVTALQRLKTSQQVDLYYLWGVSPTEALLPIADSQKLPVIAETTVKEATVGKPLVIRAARTGERIAKALAAELENRTAKQVSFVVTQIPFYLDILQHLEKILTKKGIAISGREEVLPSESDFKPILAEQNENLSTNSFLGVFLLPSQTITFYRQAEQLKLDLKTFNADILDSNTLVKECPSNINGTFYTQVGVTPQFRQKYKAKFGNDIQIGSAAQAYDIAKLVSDLFGGIDQRLSPKEVISIVSGMQSRNGATGVFGFSETPDGGKEIRMPVSMKIVRNWQLETLKNDTGV